MFFGGKMKIAKVDSFQLSVGEKFLMEIKSHQKFSHIQLGTRDDSVHWANNVLAFSSIHCFPNFCSQNFVRDSTNSVTYIELCENVRTA